MRDREQSPFALQYDSAPRPSSASLRSAPSPRGRQGCVSHPTPNRGGACRAKRSPRRNAPEICCSAQRSLKTGQTGTQHQSSKRALPKPVEGPLFPKNEKPGTPRISKGPRPFVELRRSAAAPPQLLLGGSTPLFFAQLRRIPIAVGSFAALRIWDAGLGSRKRASWWPPPEKTALAAADGILIILLPVQDQLFRSK